MLRIRWFPASWLIVERDDATVYVDPAYIRSYFDSYPSRVDYARWPDPIDGLPEPDLPTADAILITHAHKDHCKAVTVRRVSKPETAVYAPARCRAELGKGFTPVAEGDSFSAAGFEVTAVPAYNTPGGRSTKKQHKRGDGVGYVLRAGDSSIYHAGDTDLIPEMERIADIDCAFLPIGGRFTMDPVEAAEAVSVIAPGSAVPMHYRDPRQAEDFAVRLQRAGTRCSAIGIGESVMV